MKTSMYWMITSVNGLMKIIKQTGQIISFCILPVMFYSSLGHAHDVIVQKETNLLQLPDSESESIITLEPGFEVKLLENLPQNSYYHVFHKKGNGWVPVGNVIVRQEYTRGEWKYWIDEDDDGQNTRVEVLIDESLTSKDLVLDEKGKRVISGKWVDPYTGDPFTIAKDLDVDHMVPLKNAHVSGGWLWDWEKRRRFANDLEFPEHLIAVSASANRSKGARGPDEWMPPRKEYWCEYVKNWEAIKSRWDLTMTEAERDEIQNIKKMCSQSE